MNALGAPTVSLGGFLRIAIGLGSSLGDRRGTLERTLRELDATVGLTLLRVSRWYRTPPMRGGSARGWFLNGVALYECALKPGEVLARCRELEERAGRRRARFWGDRTLDLDVLVVEGVRSDDPELTLPHPGIPNRPFVLLPLAEAWPDAIDARTGQRYRDLPVPSGPRPVPVGVVASRLVRL